MKRWIGATLAAVVLCGPAPAGGGDAGFGRGPHGRGPVGVVVIAPAPSDHAGPHALRQRVEERLRQRPRRAPTGLYWAPEPGARSAARMRVLDRQIDRLGAELEDRR